jgi:hypothetical protein
MESVKYNVNPELININPELMHINPELININPELININPELININPELININPELIYTDNRHNHKDNGSCYHFERLEFSNSNVLLDIDATYVIHLVNNGRLDSVKAQLNEFKPSKEVFILHNKGYKKCKKDTYINKAPLDLVDAYLYIFKDAQKKDYKHILILEDDFIFNNKIKDKKVRQHIMNFISNKNYDIYALGTLPIIQKAYDNNTSLCTALGAHAIIYSREYINKTLQIDKRSIKDWEQYIGGIDRRYMYNEPLCYQLFPKTENQELWTGFSKIAINLLNLLKLDVQVEPGYSIAYTASKGLYGLCIIFLVWLFITIFNI